MKIHLLSGFLGSGKTTAIRQACMALAKEKIKTAVITNDQGASLVDSGYFSSLNMATREVVNGCFCCNYHDLDRQISSLVAAEEPDIIFAESVGSCTDIVATVIKPLLRYRPDITVTISTFADALLLQKLISGEASFFDESVRYIYFKQLEEAGTIVISKADLAGEKDIREVHQRVEERYPGRTILLQNCLSPGDIRSWLRSLDGESSAATLPSIDINYDFYGEGEASLAWLDQELEIFSERGDAARTAIGLTKAIYRQIQVHQYPIGHLKFLLDGKTRISFTASSPPETNGVQDTVFSHSARLLINARVQTAPHLLSQLVNRCVQEAEALSGCRIIVCSSASFQPGYPVPEHRFSD